MNPMLEIGKLFNQNERGEFVADFEDLRRKDEEHLSIPGLKRWCDLHRKAGRIVIETDCDLNYVKMWFKGNNDIHYDNIVKAAKKEVTIEVPVIEDEEKNSDRTPSKQKKGGSSGRKKSEALRRKEEAQASK